MIVDTNSKDFMTNTNVPESPPAYDYVAGAAGGSGINIDTHVKTDTKGPSQETPQPSSIYPAAAMMVSSNIIQPGYMQVPNIHHYVNPTTGEHVASLLPPGHPEMVCLQAGMHVPQTKYGILGILAALFWFPLGIGLCLLDRRVKCERCGAVLNDGLCN